MIPIAKFKTVNMPEVSNRSGENGKCAMGRGPEWQPNRPRRRLFCARSALWSFFFFFFLYKKKKKKKKKKINLCGELDAVLQLGSPILLVLVLDGLVKIEDEG